MTSIGKALSLLGQHGPALLIASLVFGAIARPVSDLAAEFVSASAFLLTLGSFLSAALSPPEGSIRTRRLVIVLAFVGIFMPIATFAFVVSIGLEPVVQLAVMVSVLAPPVGSAAAIAAMLGLRPRLALTASISLTLAAPVAMPAALAAFGVGIAVDFTAIVLRLLLIIGAGAVITAAVLRWRNQTRPMLPDAGAAAGLSVVGLVIVGLAVSSGIAPVVTEDSRGLELFSVAVGLNLASVLLGTMLFLSAGASEALTVGLLAGNRNVTLAWAIAGPSLPADAQVYLVLCVIPVLTLPLLLRTAHRTWNRAATAMLTRQQMGK